MGILGETVLIEHNKGVYKHNEYFFRMNIKNYILKICACCSSQLLKVEFVQSVYFTILYSLIQFYIHNFKLTNQRITFFTKAMKSFFCSSRQYFPLVVLCDTDWKGLFFVNFCPLVIYIRGLQFRTHKLLYLGGNLHFQKFEHCFPISIVHFTMLFLHDMFCTVKYFLFYYFIFYTSKENYVY